MEHALLKRFRPLEILFLLTRRSTTEEINLMKNTLLLSLLFASPVIAGTSQVIETAPAPVYQDNTWDWFVGGTAGYLFDADEDIYTLQLGTNSPWSVSGWSVALFVEAGWTENHDTFAGPGPGGNPVLDIVPITFNAKLEKTITGNLSAYVGGGLGPAYIEGDYSPAFGGSQDDWVLSAQAFAGVAYKITPAFEVFTGARWLWLDDPNFAGTKLEDDISVEGGLRFYF